MATKKVTMTIPEELLTHAQTNAQRAGLNLSAYTARLIRQAAVAEALDIIHAEGSPVDDEWLDEAEAALLETS